MSDSCANLHRVFSPELSEDKCWFAINSDLCCLKPSVFCSSASALLFQENYKKLKLVDVIDASGNPASSRWFNSHHRTEDVYVASAFGLLAGLLRGKNLEKCLFLKSNEFKRIVQAINKQGFSTKPQEHDDENGVVVSRLRNKGKILEDQLASTAKELIEIRAKLQDWVPPSPPSSPGEPKGQYNLYREPIPPKRKRAKSSALNLESIKNDKDLAPATKKRRIAERASNVISHINDVCRSYGESFGTVLGECCVLARKEDPHGARKAIKEAFDKMVKEKGASKAFGHLLSEEAWDSRVEIMRVPDWTSLLFKLKARLSDSAWVTMTNLTQLGRSGKKCDTPIIILKNQVAALRKGVFGVTKDIMDIKPIEELPGYEVSLESVVVWCIREQRLHNSNLPEKLTFNLKMDGRPFFGKSQVTIGIVPIDASHMPLQSAKCVYTLAIANCEENRDDLKKLMSNLNVQKNALKEKGISIDGKRFKLSFKVTLDYKGLLLLMAKNDDENFKLGGRGLSVEFCIFCLALRACDCDLGVHEVCAEHFLQTKANIGGFKGLRDDLTCLLEEDLSSLCLCALHCEMRNTEQLLRSIGLFAYEIGTLEDCNDELAKYGPQTIKADRITVKMRPGQGTKIDRHNISICSFSGSTERHMLDNIEEIVGQSLKLEKVEEHFKDPDSAKRCVLKKVSFCESRKKYYQDILEKNTFTRDYGERQEEIPLNGTAVHKELVKMLTFWSNKLETIQDNFLKHYVPQAKAKRGSKKPTKLEPNEQLTSYAAALTIEFYKKVCTDWRDIALKLRTKTYKDDEEHLIDEIDVQCKEWGFLLLEVFGKSLGTGDYGHLTIEHAPMLLRIHRSFTKFSNQGFEAAHKLQRQLYTKATSHDCKSYISSLEQIFSHLYAEMLLNLRYSFREAKRCALKGEAFHYRGCGWKSKNMQWSQEDVQWIIKMNDLFANLFGPDFCKYDYSKKNTCMLVEDQLPKIKYVHSEWEKEFLKSKPNVGSGDSPKNSPLKPTQAKESHSKKAPINSNNHKQFQSGPSFPDITKALSMNNATRGEMALFQLPPVVNIPLNDIVIVKPIQNPDDPLLLSQWPSQGIVDHARRLYSAHKARHTQNCAIRLGTLGIFREDSLSIFHRLCEIKMVKNKVKEEENWLGRDNSANSQTILQFLQGSRADEEVLSHGQFLMDIRDFSTLACERYVNGFAIDVICMKAQLYHPLSPAIYLPTYTQTWAGQGVQFLSERIEPFFSTSHAMIKHILLTIHDSQHNHWGVVCFDIEKKLVLYDDGLKSTPPSDTSTVVTTLLQAINTVSNMPGKFIEAEWKSSLPLPRFNMPLQPKHGEGAGSCGIGVILAIMDFIRYNGNSLPNFSWKFEDMSSWRKHLMMQVLTWRN